MITYSYESDPSTQPLQVWQRTLPLMMDIFQKLANNIVIIPGNHDLPEYYETHHSTDFKNVVINFASVRLFDGLIFTGIGGCVPGFVLGKQLFDGYPFHSDKQLAEELDRTHIPELATIFPDDDILFFSHNGPDQAFTSSHVKIDKTGASTEIIKHGSRALSHLFLSKAPMNEQLKSHTLLFAHGHTHHSPGYTLQSPAHPIIPHMSDLPLPSVLPPDVAQDFAAEDDFYSSMTFALPPVLNPGALLFVLPFLYR